MKRRSEVFYDLLEAFYSAMLIFEEQREEYEHSVLTLARRENVDRTELRLPANEVARLLDFKVLSRLRDRYLMPLRENTRRLFGGTDRDIFDIMVSDIFHLVSILKEEEFRVSHYAVLYDKMKRTADRDFILETVQHDFPLLLNQTHQLFLQAQVRLHDHLPRHAHDGIVVRSVYLYGPSYLESVYQREGGLAGFYRHMYPDGGALEAYLMVTASFADGGFWTEARGALERAQAHADDPEASKSRLDALLADLQRRVP
jgi:hypothetical protein